jgi:ribosomal protein L7Ae-like RNA K-turn-binding protein
LIQNKILSYIGLATKAGKIASGEFMTEKSIKEGRARLVIVAKDASDNTKKNFSDMCAYYRVPIYFFADKATLGHGMGKEMRASLAILDEGLAKAAGKQLKEGGREYGENENL